MRGSMAIDTKRVLNRRQLRFENEQQILDEAERLIAGNARVMGNWSAGQILKHLAIVMDGSIDGINFRAPWFIRVVAPLFKRRILTGRMPPGFKLSPDAEAKIVPSPAISVDEGLQALRASVARQHSTPTRKPSPFLGSMTREDWTKLHCRHAELHLSFLTVDETV